MKKIEILIVIDSAGALASGNLENNVYMVDTNQWLGSWNEGQCNLHTLCADQQLLCWRVEAISEDSEVSIADFNGTMIQDRVCVPRQAGDGSWEGRVETQGGFGRYSYTATLAIDGNQLSFTPYVDVQ